jgi:hypothetical protein
LLTGDYSGRAATHEWIEHDARIISRPTTTTGPALGPSRFDARNGGSRSDGSARQPLAFVGGDRYPVRR